MSYIWLCYTTILLYMYLSYGTRDPFIDIFYRWYTIMTTGTMAELWHIGFIPSIAKASWKTEKAIYSGCDNLLSRSLSFVVKGLRHNNASHTGGSDCTQTERLYALCYRHNRKWRFSSETVWLLVSMPGGTIGIRLSDECQSAQFHVMASDWYHTSLNRNMK